jgi:hypothetical protein
MNTGKEFPSTCIKFPSSPDFVRRATRPVRLHLISARPVAPAAFGMGRVIPCAPPGGQGTDPPNLPKPCKKPISELSPSFSACSADFLVFWRSKLAIFIHGSKQKRDGPKQKHDVSKQKCDGHKQKRDGSKWKRDGSIHVRNRPTRNCDVSNLNHDISKLVGDASKQICDGPKLIRDGLKLVFDGKGLDFTESGHFSNGKGWLKAQPK